MTAFGHGPIAFNAGFSEAALLGSPRVIRLWKRSASSIEPRLFSVTEFLPGQKTVGREVYREEGSLSVREVYRYEAGNGVTLVELLDQSGKLLQRTRKTELPRAGEWEYATFDGEGRELTRNVVKLDKVGDVERAEMTDLRKGSRIFLLMEKDPSGVPVRSEVRFEGLPQPFDKMETLYHRGEDHATTTCYAADGTVLVQSEIITHPNGLREIRQGPGDVASSAMRIRGERVVSRDAHGNWTGKFLFEGFGEGLPAEPSEIHSREISYY